MYEKPKLERFGTFEELTKVGIDGRNDGWTINGADGCEQNAYFNVSECRS